MSLISLLIALAAERSLSSSKWQFNVYYQKYLKLTKALGLLNSLKQNKVYSAVFILVPVLLSIFILSIFEHGIIHFILSTLLLIVCFGCFKTRDCYKQYLMSAFRGEMENCHSCHESLAQDKGLPELSFGQLLIWLNYRYFIAIMFFFVLFGASGALFYRLLTCVLEKGVTPEGVEVVENSETEAETEECETQKLSRQLLSLLDWLPVRIVTLGYMFVGHFSKALPVWLENLLNISKPSHEVLIEVAEKSEDFMTDNEDDCTAEPCLLVRIAKRTSLLCLSVLSLLILVGVIH